MNIAIVTLATGHYIEGARVLFNSIIKNTKIDNIDLIYMTDRLDNMEEYDFDISVQRLDISKEISLSTNDRFKQTTKKLLALEREEYDRIIIMDSDMLCLNDLSYLFSEKLNNYDFLVTKDLAANKYYNGKLSDIGLDKNNIFNTGLMIWNKPLLGKNKFKQLIEELKTCQTYDGGDQGYLNHWVQKYNIKIGYINYIFNHPLDSNWPIVNINETCVLHYTNPNFKPWQDKYPENEEKLLWEKYKNE